MVARGFASTKTRASSSQASLAAFYKLALG